MHRLRSVWRVRRSKALAVVFALVGLSVSPSASPIPCLPCTSDPVEPVWSELGTQTRVKSPAQHMHFTAGMPLRLLADALDANAWMCPPGHPPYVCPGTEVRFNVDGQLVGTVPPSPNDMNLWELRLPSGLPAGDHVVTVTYVPFSPGGGGTPIAGAVPVTIHVDPAPSHGGTIVLTQHLVLSGSTPLDWTDKTVIGNGFRVTAAAGYSGSVTIRNSFVSGLGSFSTSGLDVTTTGAVSVQDSIFEATGAMRIAAQGGASVTVTNNELRANNLLTYVASNPDVPVALELVGGNSGAKVVQGNRIGAGILRLHGNAWQIGGLAPGEGNVLMGPRAVLHLVNSSNDIIQGNYLRHDYHGGFSQGLNLWLEGSSDNELVEHNVIRGGSWPVQNFGGEFRYNLVIDSGHNFWRGAADLAQIHHNVFAHASGVNTGYSGAILVFGGVAGLNVYNNTFDLAGQTGSFDAPAFTIGSGSVFNSIRNNLFTHFVEVSTVYGRAFVSSDDAVGVPRVSSADYNAFYNPLAPTTVRYRAGIVATTPGQHDVQINPQLSGDPEVPYRISEGCVWIGACTVGQVLGHYRNVYRPAPGSPLINAGDPADGADTAIGAVGPDDNNPVDLFGRLVPTAPPPPDTLPPTVTLTAPAHGSTVSGVTTISATAFDNIGVAGVRFLIDGTQTGSEQTGTPYALAWDTATASNASHTITAIARDAAGNTTTSAAVSVTVSNVAPPPPPPGGLVAAYGFEEGTGTTTANAAGAGLTGTLSSATWQAAGKFGKALQFTGGNGSWVTVPDAPALRLTTGMTISAWVRPTAALQAEPTVLFKERSGSLAYGLYANSGGGQPIVWYTSNGAFNFISLAGGSAVPVNAWTYLAATFDGATLRMFIDGQLVGSQASNAPIDAATGVLRIGGNNIWSGEGFPGLIDEVRIYNRALSQAEIQADMNTPVVTP